MNQVNQSRTATRIEHDVHGRLGPLAKAPNDSARTIDRRWTRGQLQAAADMDRAVQRDPQHMVARMALANHVCSSDLERIRKNVVRSLGGVAGTYYIVAALHLAYLASSFPSLLTDVQQDLLMAPLVAAEKADGPAGPRPEASAEATGFSLLLTA